ncbi:hypothetical protein EXIGLDRAFT_766980 [Exidia glandulosa HHB12029]|uniref:Uncharacterized protein n=1 Tax=Exidia glandulosa HHB12029 TaxID=1314781 RepID=A0A165JAB7_EXIGL|nr:hypothetical protein EXIGLDRAFT_766980 [Exidia glandulosa HHB12029]
MAPAELLPELWDAVFEFVYDLRPWHAFDDGATGKERRNHRLTARNRLSSIMLVSKLWYSIASPFAWRDLTLSLRATGPRSPLPQSARVSAGLTRTLHLVYFLKLEADFRQLVSNMTALRELSCPSLEPNDVTALEEACGSSLTTLCLRGPNSTLLRSPKFFALQELQISYLPIGSGPTGFVLLLDLPQLVYLAVANLRIIPAQDTPATPGNTRYPALRRLRMLGVGWPRDQTAEALQSFFVTHGAQLSHYRMSGIISQPFFTTVSGHFSNLQHLSCTTLDTVFCIRYYPPSIRTLEMCCHWRTDLVVEPSSRNGQCRLEAFFDEILRLARAETLQLQRFVIKGISWSGTYDQVRATTIQSLQGVAVELFKLGTTVEDENGVALHNAPIDILGLDDDDR